MLDSNEDFITVNEKFPHIGKKLAVFWGQLECCELFINLMLDTRDGKRQGFPKEIAQAIHRLSMLYDEKFPQYVKSDHPWFNAR